MRTNVLFVAVALCCFVNTQFIFAEAVILYDVDFSSPPHVVGLPAKTGDTAFPRKTPYSIISGTPVVESSLGQLTDQPMVCRGNNTMYFPVNQEEMSWYYLYTFEMDILMTDGEPLYDNPNPSGEYNSLKIILDTPEVRRLFFRPDGSIYLGLAGAGIIGNYNRGVPFRLRMEINLELEELKIFIDGSLLGTFDFLTDTLENFRLISWSYQSIPVGIDNVKISGDNLEYPDITEFEITGADMAIEGRPEQLNAFVEYNDGYKSDIISNLVEWSLSSDEFASIDDHGLLQVGEIDSPVNVTVYTQYSKYGVTVNTEKTVSLMPLVEEVRYSITDLGTLGGNWAKAYSINDRGQVAGESWIAGSYTHHAFFYDGTTMHDLGTLGGTNSEAYGINEKGHVVGWSEIAGDSATHACWYDGTSMHDLGTLGGTNSKAYAINDNGHIVGWSEIAGDWATHAFLYDGTEMHDIGTLGGNYSAACAINNKGQVLGNSKTAGGDQHAFLFDGTEIHDIGTLGGTYLSAYGINETGQIVGRIAVAGESANHAFLYDGTAIDDPTILGGNCTDALGINDSGQVVGYGFDRSTFYAFVYDRIKGLFDLNNLIALGSDWELLKSQDINASGQIVGWGRNDEKIQAFLLTPIPEPCNYVLIGDLDDNCKVNFIDFAMMDIEDLAVIAINWLVDCNADPSDPACVSK